MVTESDKYSAETMKVSGFALMTPFGRIIIQPVVVFNELGSVSFIIYFVFTFFLFLYGGYLVAQGYNILREKELI